MRWFLLGLAVVALMPLQAADVKKAYPASFELARVADGDRVLEVLASGEALLLAGETVTVEGDGRGDGSGATIRFLLEMEPPEAGAERGKLILHSRVELARVSGRTRLQAPDSPDSYIEGPNVRRTTHTAESWRRMGDPTPIVVPFTRDGQRYRLTVIIDPVYTTG
ncbi:hypothetical protein H0Z60_01450 [Ectothiorhodospiraceae bacterium WFHF3C12]|nr:hypothetical protein [Ectothiorhodospiraceae bacterium WFHF3C12]